MKYHSCFVLFILTLCSPVFSYHDSSPAQASKGRGIVISAPSAVVTSNSNLTLLTPTANFVGDFEQETKEQLNTLDLTNAFDLASNLHTGILHGQTLFNLELKYRESEQCKTVDLSHHLKSVSSCSGNIHFNFSTPINDLLPQTIEQVTLTLLNPTNSAAEEKGLKGPIPVHTACCDCSGWCAFLWITFAFCNSCLEPQGAEYCCKNCHVPPAPGESCD